MRYDPKDMRTELDAAIQEDDLVHLAWVLVKVVRHGRIRCRNNKALYNWLAPAFPELQFSEVPKTDFKGKPYMGLKVTHRNSGMAMESGSEDED